MWEERNGEKEGSPRRVRGRPSSLDSLGGQSKKKSLVTDGKFPFLNSLTVKPIKCNPRSWQYKSHSESAQKSAWPIQYLCHTLIISISLLFCFKIVVMGWTNSAHQIPFLTWILTFWKAELADQKFEKSCLHTSQIWHCSIYCKQTAFL